MFKHVLITTIVIIVVYFIIKKLNIVFHKIYISKNISKYHLTENDKCLLDMYSTNYTPDSFKNNTFIFYTHVPWNALTNNNYIYSKKNDNYSIIDNLFYYYIDDIENYDIVINSKNIKVFTNFKKVNLV